MDLAIYQQQKSAGVSVLVKVGADTVAFISPKFDEATGTPKPATMEQFNLKAIDDQIVVVQAQLSSLQAFRADVVAELAKEVKAAVSL